jgi:hypothetical protein
MVFWMNGTGGGHVQSLILAAILMVTGLLSMVVGLVGDLISVNRKLLEKIDWRVRGLEDRMSTAPATTDRTDRSASGAAHE